MGICAQVFDTELAAYASIVAMMKNILMCRLLVVMWCVAFSSVIAGPVRAATTTPDAASSVPQQAVLIATTDIRNATLAVNEDRTLRIAFDITNESGVQPRVRYGIVLVATDANGNKRPVDWHLFEETLRLEEHSKAYKEIEYVVPPGITGPIEVVLQAANTAGLLLGVANLGTVALAPAPAPSIVADPCFLTVAGEFDGSKYALWQGVDISAGETLQLHCTIRNSGSEPLSVNPRYETRTRSPFGDVVEHQSGDQLPFMLAASSSKDVVLTLPKVEAPQAYALVVSFTPEVARSNTLVVQYISEGETATLSTVSLDKDSYINGDTAKIMFVWSGAPGDFLHSRRFKKEFGAQASSTKRGPVDTATTAPAEPKIKPGQPDRLQVTLVSDGVDCAAARTEQVGNQGIVTMDLPVTTDCPHPTLTVSVLDREGKALDSMPLSRERAPLPDETTIHSLFARIPHLVWIVGGIVLLVCVIVMVVMRRRARATTPNVILP